jgi:tetratricopeptide (TPR) repeat protein
MTAIDLHEEILQSPDIRNTMCKIAEIKVTLADISVKLYRYDLASEHLESALRLCEGRSKLDNEKSKVAEIDIKLANGYAKLEQYDLVDQHLARALSIYREINDLQYECRTRVTTVANGRIQRRKRSCSIVYVTKYNRLRSYLVVFLDPKIATASHHVVYDEIRRICNRHK